MPAARPDHGGRRCPAVGPGDEALGGGDNHLRVSRLLTVFHPDTRNWGPDWGQKFRRGNHHPSVAKVIRRTRGGCAVRCARPDGGAAPICTGTMTGTAFLHEERRLPLMADQLRPRRR